MSKLDRSKKMVQELVKERNHEIMIKQELRKLKEEDMKLLVERQRRVAMRKKIEILDKENQRDRARSELKQTEKKIIEKRYLNTCKLKHDRAQISQDLKTWATISLKSPSKKNLDKAASPKLKEYAKMLSNPKLLAINDDDEGKDNSEAQ
jgi:hypothetical protein